MTTSALRALLLAAVAGMADPQPAPPAAREPPKPQPNEDSLLFLLSVAPAAGVRKRQMSTVSDQNKESSRSTKLGFPCQLPSSDPAVMLLGTARPSSTWVDQRSLRLTRFSINEKRAKSKEVGAEVFWSLSFWHNFRYLLTLKNLIWIYSCSSFYNWLMIFSGKEYQIEDTVFMTINDSRDSLIFRKANWKNGSQAAGRFTRKASSVTLV